MAGFSALQGVPAAQVDWISDGGGARAEALPCAQGSDGDWKGIDSPAVIHS